MLPILERDCRWFSFHLGGTGHLNGTATQQFCADYCRQVLNQGSGILFDSGELLTSRLQKPPAAANFVSEFSADWPAAFSEFVLSKRLLIERSARSTNPDVEKITGSLAPEGPWGIDGVVMLLAVLSDQEIDSAVYLRGLSGRENIPWYIARFFRESRSYIESLSRSCKLLDLPEKVSLPCSYEATIAAGLEPVWRRLFGFRETLFRAIVAPYYNGLESGGPARANSRSLEFQPERLISAVVELIRGYYTFYNRPEWRVEFGRLDPDQIIGALRLSIVLRDVVSRTVTLLKNACDNDDFTLLS